MLSNVRRSIGQKPVLSARPIASATLAARIGGMTLMTSALMTPASVVTVMALASMASGRPPCFSCTHSRRQSGRAGEAYLSSLAL